MTSLRDIADAHTGRARTTLRYALATKSVVDGTKGLDFSRDSWKPLRNLVVPEKFVRIDLYLQMTLPATEMLEGYEGVEISG